MRLAFCLGVAMALLGVAAYAQDAGDTSGSTNLVDSEDLESDPESRIVIPDEEEPAEEGQNAAGPLVSTWDFVRMILVLASVVGAIYLLFSILKRASGGPRVDNNLIRVLDHTALSGSRALYLVEVGTSLFLVGAAENAVNLVSEVTDKESVDSIRLAVAQTAERPQSANFGAVLGGLFGSTEKNGGGRDLSFIRNQKERLKRLQ